MAQQNEGLANRMLDALDPANFPEAGVKCRLVTKVEEEAPAWPAPFMKVSLISPPPFANTTHVAYERDRELVDRLKADGHTVYRAWWVHPAQAWEGEPVWRSPGLVMDGREESDHGSDDQPDYLLGY